MKMDNIPAWPGVPEGFSWLTPLLLLLGCCRCLFTPMTPVWSYQRDVCLATMREKMCKKVSTSTVNQQPLSAAWLWRLRHSSLCSPANDGLLDPRLKGPVLATRDGWALSFWQGLQHPVCLVNGSLVVSHMRLCVCVQRAAFSIPVKETWRGLCKEYIPELYLCSF